MCNDALLLRPNCCCCPCCLAVAYDTTVEACLLSVPQTLPAFLVCRSVDHIQVASHDCNNKLILRNRATTVPIRILVPIMTIRMDYGKT